MNLKMSPRDSVIQLVKWGEHDGKMDLGWEGPELGTDARLSTGLPSKPEVSHVAPLQSLSREHVFVLRDFHLNGVQALNDIYLCSELILDQ